jgi:hypothetical protein
MTATPLADFGKPPGQHRRAARERARKLREEATRRRQIEAAMLAFAERMPTAFDRLH